MIPKKIHYCWFGRNELPETAKKCIDSWKEYFPDFDYDEETGQAYILPSQTPDTFKGRYNRGILKGKFSIDAYMQNRELQDLLTTLDLDAEKFWYLLLFCYDCSWGKCMEGK